MIRMFVRHPVAEYDSWRKVYDGLASYQAESGVVAKAVYQSVEDPHDITVTHDFNTLDQAKAFVASEGLHDAMQRAGVTGPPTIWFTQMKG